MKAILFLTACVASLWGTAQQGNPTNNDSLPLQDVIVSGIKQPQSKATTTKQVQIISRNKIANNPGKTLSQLLVEEAGIYITGSQSAWGTNQGVSVRGAATGNTLILLNGVPLLDASGINQAFDLNHISPQLIERVEIVKAAQSSLYGTDAVAGIINIITKTDANKNFAPNVSLALGNLGQWQIGAGFQSKINNNQQVQLQYKRTQAAGISAARSKNSNQVFEKDNFEQNNVMLQWQIKTSTKNTSNFVFNFNNYKAGIDAGAFTDDKDYTLKNSNLNIQYQNKLVLKKGNLISTVGYNKTERNFLDDSTDRQSFSYYSKSKYLSSTAFTDIMLTKYNKQFNYSLGVEGRYATTTQDYKSISMFGPYNSYLGNNINYGQASIYAAYNQYSRNHNVGNEFSARYTYSSLLGSNVVGNFGTYKKIKNWRITLGANTGFRLPSLFQLFAEPYNNKNLKPEKSYNLEATVQYNKNNWQTGVSLYRRTVRNVIQFVRLDTTVLFDYKYLNFDKELSYGLEWFLTGKINQKTQLNLNYTFTDGSLQTKVAGGINDNNNLGKPLKINLLYRQPKHHLVGNINHTLNSKWAIQSTLRYVGERFEPQYNQSPIRLSAYHTADVSVQFKPKTGYLIYTQVQNLTNSKFYDIWGFNNQPLNVLVGCQINF
jgi:vitamin B12 transporter